MPKSCLNVDGKTIRLLDDGSHVWAHNPDNPYAHADNVAGLIGAFKRRLLESPESDAVNLAQITIATNRLAVLWARMFLAAAKRPDVLGALMWPYASSSPFLKSVDTRKDAIDAVAAFYPTLSADDRKSFEEGVKTITFEEYENPERNKRRFLATLFRAIGNKNLATPEAKNLLAEALAESVPVGNNRIFSVFTETRAPDPYWWLTEKGVDVESAANAALLLLTEGLPDGPAPDGTQTKTISDDAHALMALNAALQKPTQPLPSPLVTQYAQSQLLHGCVTLARRKNELASEAGIVGALADLIEPHLGDGNESGSSEPLNKLRAPAAEAALSLCAVNQATATRLVPKIEPLLSGSAENVRAAIADNIGRLWHFDRPALWRFAEYFAKHETNFAVLRHFTQFLIRAVHSDPSRVEALIIDLMPRARQETDAQGDRIIEGIGNLVACLWLRYELARSRELLDSWMKDLLAHALELNRAAAALRDIVISGYDTGKEDDIRLRRNAQRLARDLVEVSTTVVQRYVAIEAASRTDADNSEAQAAVRLLDNVGNQLYFSSGAFRANEQEKPSGLATLEARKAFLNDTAEILHRIGDAGSPHTIYYLIDLFGLLREADPARVFDLVAHALLDAGRMHGFQFESLGADRFVEIVGIFLADHREIFNDQNRRQKLIACLDAFVEAGWPKARRLLYRLPELL